MRLWFLLCIPLSILLPLTATAQEAAESPVDEAARHFSNGLTLAKNEKYLEAIDEFERAYQLSPHYSVLYNLGLVYNKAGMAAEAVTTLRRYIAEGGKEIQPEQEQSAMRVIQANLSRTGQLKLTLRPEVNAPAIIDTKTIDATTLKSDVVLNVGSHFFWISAPGFKPQHVRFRITASQLTKLEVHLEPETKGEATGAAALAVRCNVPNAMLAIDGKQSAPLTAHSALSLPAGSHRLEFSREGYQSNQVQLTLSSGARSDIDCGLAPLPKLPPNKSARLAISAAPKSVVLVNGARYRGEALPLGEHDVEVTHPDYLAFKQRLTLTKPGVRELTVPTMPTQERTKELDAGRANLRLWGYIIGGAGLALGTTALVVYVKNENEFDAYKQRKLSFERDQWKMYREGVQASTTDDEATKRVEPFQVRLGRLNNDIQRIQRHDDLALALALGGGACLGAAGYLLWRGFSKSEPPRSRLFATTNSVGWSTTW